MVTAAIRVTGHFGPKILLTLKILALVWWAQHIGISAECLKDSLDLIVKLSCPMCRTVLSNFCGMLRRTSV